MKFYPPHQLENGEDFRQKQIGLFLLEHKLKRKQLRSAIRTAKNKKSVLMMQVHTSGVGTTNKRGAMHQIGMPYLMILNRK